MLWDVNQTISSVHLINKKKFSCEQRISELSKYLYNIDIFT